MPNANVAAETQGTLSGSQRLEAAAVMQSQRTSELDRDNSG